MTGARTLLTALAAPVVAALLVPSHATAQYFGQNKVQYDDFEWRVIRTENLDVHFYERTREASVEMARAAERWHWRLARVFDHQLTERKPVVMYANHPDFQQTNIIGGEIGLGTGGVTDAARNRATQPYTGDFHSTSHVVGHELVHVFQYDIAATTTGVRGMQRLPLWLIEGMAEYLSVGRVDPHTAMWLRDAVLRGDVPTVQDLSTGRYFPYRYGQGLMAYIGGRWGDRAVVELYRTGLEVGLGAAIDSVTGLTPDQLSREWAVELRRTYLPLVLEREAPEDVGRDLFETRPRDRNLHLAPSVSPDGETIAFISDRGLFSLDVYLADVDTGEIIRRLNSANREPHFDALNFLETAGAWSPDGRYFAYVVVDEGDNELRIADAERGGTVRSIEFDELDALNDPAWSPDGRRIAFSGGSGGLSDLYIYDREADRVQQLTDDLYAQIQPAWSPDGRTLAYVTDAGPDTDLGALSFGPFRLAAVDLETNRHRLLPSFRGAKHIDPHFSPDGRSLYFISDRGGVSDIFRLELAADEFFRVTRTATGVSGITGHSPALTVASRTGRLVFSIFADNQYTLHVLEADEAGGERVSGSADVAPAGVLPPTSPDRATTPVDEYLSSPLAGLPRDPQYAIEDYDPDLGLEYIGPPMIGASVDQFGTQIGGAVSFAFRDLLGNRTLGVAAQAQGELQDIGGTLVYEDREGRLNWGVLGGRIPYRSGRRGVEQVDVDGQTALLVRDQIFRTYINQLGGQLAYPFSTTRRSELNASYTRYSYDAEEQRFLCGVGGQDCRAVDELPLEDLEPDPVNLFQASAAYVGDWANFAFTGPVAGTRFRFEAEPTFGDLQFVSALADYRRYLFFRPATLAFRALHFGRYGRDSDNQRLLTPLFLGSGDLVRGYTIDSFRSDECAALNGGVGCPEFDRLVGSRIGVANVELRYPLFGTADFGLLEFPVLPTTIGLFADIGVAWTGDESPELSFDTDGADRVPVASAGALARVNVLGFMVVSTWVAHPFHRPQRDWVFGLQLTPGW